LSPCARNSSHSGVEFVGIAIDNPASVAQFLQQKPVNYPILIGEGAAHSLARQLGNPSGALPYTIVLDRDGKDRAEPPGAAAARHARKRIAQNRRIVVI
jgi:peroxiredoxin